MEASGIAITFVNYGQILIMNHAEELLKTREEAFTIWNCLLLIVYRIVMKNKSSEWLD